MIEDRGQAQRREVSRRGFLRGVALSAGAAAVPGEGLLAVDGLSPAEEPGKPRPLGPGAVPIALQVNGAEVKLEVEPRTTLLDALRDRLEAGTARPLDLTGSKKVCDRGACGACTVIIDGRAVYACTTLAIEAQGKKIETIEGLGRDGKPHPLQEAFVRQDGLMCGFCTSGFLMSSKALLDRNPYPSREEIRKALDGNICRCGTYVRVFEAVERASEEMRSEKGG